MRKAPHVSRGQRAREGTKPEPGRERGCREVGPHREGGLKQGWERGAGEPGHNFWRGACQAQGVSEGAGSRAEVTGRGGEQGNRGLQGAREGHRSYRALWTTVLTFTFILIMIEGFGRLEWRSDTIGLMF